MTNSPKFRPFLLHSPTSASTFASMYASDPLTGGHVIMLGGGNTEAATNALRAYPGGLQVGGGVNDTNAKGWIEKGAR